MDHMAKYYKNLSEHLFNQRDHLLRLLNEKSKTRYKDIEDENIADWSNPNATFNQWEVDPRYGTDEAPTNPAQPEPGDPIDDSEGDGPVLGFGDRRGRWKPQYVKDAERNFRNSPPAPIQSAQGPFIPPLLNQPDLLTPNGPEPIQPQQPPPGIARPDPNEVPGLIGLGEPGSPGVAPLPQDPRDPRFVPQNPGVPTQPYNPPPPTPEDRSADSRENNRGKAPMAPNTEKSDYESARRAYYAKRNQQTRDQAEENLARMGALNPSSSASTNAARAVSQLRSQRALKKGNDKFNQADIDRMVKSDSKERFMSQADKDARAARNASAVAGLEKAGHEKMGHTQNARGEWVDSQGKPASLATKIERLGPDTIIQGTSMTRGEFERQTGRKYDATNREDSALVSKLAGAGKLGTEAARQGALSSDAMNQGYQKQNDEMAKETGRLDRQVDASQRELDRFRNDPKYRESQRNLDSKGNPIRTPELEAQIAAETERDVQDIKQKRATAGTNARVNQAAEVNAALRAQERLDDEDATNSMNDRVNQAARDNSDLRAQERFDSTPAELAKIRALQNRQDTQRDVSNEPGLGVGMVGPPKPGLQTRSFALQNEIEQNKAREEFDTKRKQAELDDEMRGLDLIPDTEEAPRPEFNQPTTGGQVTQAAANMTTAPAQQSVSTGGMNQPMDINDFPEEEKPQTTLPPVSGGQVTNAAANMTTQPAKPTPAGANSAVGQPQLQTRQQAPPPASAPTSVGPPSSTGTRNTTPATQPTTSPVSGNPNPVTPTVAPARNATIPQPTATPARPPAPAAPPVAVGSSVTAKAATMTTKPQLASAGAPIDPQQTGGPTAQNRGIPIPSANPMADAQAGPLGAPLKKKLVASAGRTPNIRA